MHRGHFCNWFMDFRYYLGAPPTRGNWSWHRNRWLWRLFGADK